MISSENAKLFFVDPGFHKIPQASYFELKTCSKKHLVGNPKFLWKGRLVFVRVAYGHFLGSLMELFGCVMNPWFYKKHGI